MIELKGFPFDAMEVLDETSGLMIADREYGAKIFRNYFRKFLSTGVYYGNYKNYGNNSMKVLSDGGTNIKVSKGAGNIEGADFENENDQIITLDRPLSGIRVDRVVVRLDDTLDIRKPYLYVKSGNGNVVADLQRDENIYEICIAEVTIKSTSNIETGDIKDTRTNNEICGIVNSLITLDYDEILEKFKRDLDAVIDNLVKKNEDSTINGKLIVKKGVEANVKGNLEGRADSATNADNATNAR